MHVIDFSRGPFCIHLQLEHGGDGGRWLQLMDLSTVLGGCFLPRGRLCPLPDKGVAINAILHQPKTINPSGPAELARGRRGAHDSWPHSCRTTGTPQPRPILQHRTPPRTCLRCHDETARNLIDFKSSFSSPVEVPFWGCLQFQERGSVWLSVRSPESTCRTTGYVLYVITIPNL